MTIIINNCSKYIYSSISVIFTCNIERGCTWKLHSSCSISIVECFLRCVSIFNLWIVHYRKIWYTCISRIGIHFYGRHSISWNHFNIILGRHKRKKIFIDFINVWLHIGTCCNGNLSIFTS